MDENIPKWLVCQVGSKVYKYPTCLMQYYDVNSVDILEEDESIFQKNGFEQFDALKVDEIFEACKIDDQLRISTSFQPGKDKIILESAKNFGLNTSYPLNESKADLFYNIDFSNSMRMDNFSGLSRKFESDKMIDLNLDDVAEDDFDFFGNSGVKTNVEKTLSSGPQVFSPLSTGSTPELFYTGNHFSPHTPAAANSVPPDFSPPFDHEKNIASVDTAVNDSSDKIESKIIPREIRGVLTESTVEMMPPKWLPFKFQDGKFDVLEKYGNEENFSFVPSVCLILENQISQETFAESEAPLHHEEVETEYFLAGHPLDLLGNSSNIIESYPMCIFGDLLDNFDSIHLTAQYLEFKSEIHQSFIHLFPSEPHVPNSGAEYAINLISKKLGSDMSQLQLQQYFDLQGIVRLIIDQKKLKNLPSMVSSRKRERLPIQ